MASVSKMEGQMTREGHVRGRVFEDNHRAGKGEGNPAGQSAVYTAEACETSF